MSREDRIGALIDEYRPFDAWRGCDDRDHWALVTASGDPEGNGVTWLRTFQTRDLLDSHVADQVATGERLVLMVDLDTGERFEPRLVWVAYRCAWPTCTQQPAPDGRMFLGARMCTEHTAASHALDAAARDEIEAVAHADADRG